MSLFLQEKIGFNDIPRLVKLAMDTVPVEDNATLEDVLEADRLARKCVTEHTQN